MVWGKWLRHTIHNTPHTFVAEARTGPCRDLGGVVGVVGGVDAWGQVGPNNLFSHPTLHIRHPNQTPNQLIFSDIRLRS